MLAAGDVTARARSRGSPAAGTCVGAFLRFVHTQRHLSRRNVCLQWLMRRIYARHQAREERDRLLSAARGAEVGEQERHNHSMNCL